MKQLKHKSHQSGAAALEFAVLLPLLVTLVFGSIEFGLVCYNKQVITNAGREGARMAITGGGDVVQTVLDYCNRRASDPPEVKHKLIDLTSADGRYALQAADITVTGPDGQDDFSVTVRYTYNFLFARLIGIGQTTIASRTVMRNEPN